jgi:DNA replication factor Dna2
MGSVQNPMPDHVVDDSSTLTTHPNTKRQRRQLSVSIVESGRNVYSELNRKSVDPSEQYLESMTQDCVEWDEGRHNVDLRKLADPNFQTPLNGLNHHRHPEHDDATASGTLFGSTRSSISSHDRSNNSRSPIPRRRLIRRRESLDVVTRRHIQPLNTAGISNAKENSSTSTAKDVNPKVAVVSTDRVNISDPEQSTQRTGDNKNYVNRQPLRTISESTQNLQQSTITSTIRPPVVAATHPPQRRFDGTTDFADLLHKIETDTVHDRNQTSTTINPIERGPYPLPLTSANITPPPILPVLASPTDIVNTEIEDEFGDTNFSLDDLATIDSLVHAIQPNSISNSNNKISIHSTVAPPKDPKRSTNPDIVLQRPIRQIESTNADIFSDEDPFGDIPDIDIDALVHANIRSAPMVEHSRSRSDNSTHQQFDLHTPGGLPRSPDDPFADLPDFDVEAFVQKQGDQASLIAPQGTTDKDEFSDIDFDALDVVVAQYEKSTTSTLLPWEDAPSMHCAVRNPRRLNACSNPSIATPNHSYLEFSRFKVIHVQENVSTSSKTVSLARWATDMLIQEDKVTRTLHHPSSDHKMQRDSIHYQWTIAGVIHLRGEWYHTRLCDGDIIHIVSLTGKFRTDVLPITFHTCPPQGSDADDDLVLVVHPDLLLTPTIISETVSCTRRAVLKSRLGSTGLTCT